MKIEPLIIGEYMLDNDSENEVIKSAILECLDLKISWKEKPTVNQIAKFVCEYYDVPVLELTKDRQLRYLVRIRKAIAYLAVKIYDPFIFEELMNHYYNIKTKKGLRKELEGVLGRGGPAISLMIRGAIDEYSTYNDIKLIYHYFENQLYKKYGQNNKSK